MNETRPNTYPVRVGRANEPARLEWVVDSDFRFFPAMPGEVFGYTLHPENLTTNKVAAAYGRREPRDKVDLLTIHDRILPLGAAIWAASGKTLGFTPEGIVNEIRRVARYTAADFRRHHGVAEGTIGRRGGLRESRSRDSSSLPWRRLSHR
jgi:hypothetical protein